MKRRKKWLKRVGIGLLVLIGVLVLGVVAAWQYLTSDAGSARARCPSCWSGITSIS